MMTWVFTINKVISGLLPFMFITQALLNVVTIWLDQLDRSSAFPLAVVVLARKTSRDF